MQSIDIDALDRVIDDIFQYIAKLLYFIRKKKLALKYYAKERV